MKGLGTCNAFVAHTLQSVLEKGQSDRIDYIGISAAFDSQPSGNSLQALLKGSWRFCAVYSETVSL